MAKLQITLTDQEAQSLQRQAERLGYTLIKFVKFILAKEAYKIVAESQNQTLVANQPAL